MDFLPPANPHRGCQSAILEMDMQVGDFVNLKNEPGTTYRITSIWGTDAFIIPVGSGSDQGRYAAVTDLVKDVLSMASREALEEE